MPPSPSLPQSFRTRKARILQDLSQPASTYTDASPKGSVDEGVRELIEYINSQEGWVTTSSCAGRISVFAEGRKEGPGTTTTTTTTTTIDDEGEVEENRDEGAVGKSKQEVVATASGKGGGGRWLLVSHESVSVEGDVHELLGLRPWDPNQMETMVSGERQLRFVRFAFEPMILHILTATLAHARPLLSAAINGGFRESGVQSLKSLTDSYSCPMVAIRTTGGVAMQSVIGFVGAETEECFATVPESHLRMLVRSGNQRFEGNRGMIERLGHEIAKVLRIDNEELWEDEKQRRIRKRKEGLARRDQVTQHSARSSNPDQEMPDEHILVDQTILDQLSPND
ncbi:MAG: hypothetical protein Q9227_006413 [Pyrenula ochraceoflavens]